MTKTLHYFYDPLCGWCYGAAPLIKAAREILSVRPHGGGMMTGARRQTITPQLRAYVNQHDERIAQLSGQHFGAGYVDGLLNANGTVLDFALFLGRPQDFQERLRSLTGSPATSLTAEAFSCDATRCAV